MLTKFKAPDKVWVSWCTNCGEVILADKVKARTRCLHCRYPYDNSVRYSLYVKCGTKCVNVSKKSTNVVRKARSK